MFLGSLEDLGDSSRGRFDTVVSVQSRSESTGSENRLTLVSIKNVADCSDGCLPSPAAREVYSQRVAHRLRIVGDSRHENKHDRQIKVIFAKPEQLIIIKGPLAGGVSGSWVGGVDSDAVENEHHILTVVRV